MSRACFLPVSVLSFQRHSDRRPWRADPTSLRNCGPSREGSQPRGRPSPPRCPSPEDASPASAPCGSNSAPAPRALLCCPEAHRRPQHEIAAFCSGSTVTTSSPLFKIFFPRCSLYLLPFGQRQMRVCVLSPFGHVRLFATL